MIKKLLFIFLLLFIAPNILPQTNGNIFLSLKKINEGKGDVPKTLNISSNWKFHVGDNAEWRLPSYNDSAWQNKNTAIYLDSLSPKQNTGICWFRLNIKTDSSLFGKDMALLIKQHGASEIFLDGKLINEIGKVGSDVNGEEVKNPAEVPFAVNFDSAKTHLLAIRYSYMHVRNLYEKFGQIASTAGLQVSAGILNPAVANYNKMVRINTTLNISLFGIVCALAILHLLLFFFYKSRVDNLYYSIFSFSLSINFLLGILNIYISNQTALIIIRAFLWIIIVLIFLFFIAFIYSVYYKKLPAFFKGFIVYGIFIFLMPVNLNFINHTLLNDLTLGFAILALLEGFRVIIKSLIKKIEGSWIIGIGAIAFILAILFDFIIQLFNLSSSIPEDVITLVLYSGLVSLPVFMSIYLARDFANTNKNLTQKLKEVKELSEKTIEQEKREAELMLESEREKARRRESELQAKALEAENERKAKELEEARNIQLSMLPKNLPLLPQMDIAVYMQTATEVGGDYYDFHLNSDGTLTAVLGDATGHGVKAGVMVTAVKSMFVSNFLHNEIPLMFSHFSDSIRQLNLEYMYMCLAVLKINGYQMRFASAGIPPLLLYKKIDDKLEYITLKGMPLGTKKGFPYKEIEMNLSPGDTVLLMSDGYPELFNENEEMFGYENILDFVKENISGSPEQIIEGLKKSIDKWRNGTPVRDDITFVVIKMK